MKLISMTDYVLEKSKECQFKDDCEFAYLVRGYANFLKQPIKLGMFIPCDENDVPLDEPLNYYLWLDKSLNAEYEANLSKYEEYQQAKERVIFKDCEYKGEDKDSLWIYFKQCSKEDNENSKYYYTVIYKNATLEYCVGLELTDSAIKKYNL